jgi:serine/threonine protein kinase
MSTIPQRLDKYELIECLGHGGAAEVWKARDTQLQRFVAIKMLHPNLRDDPTFLGRFQQEAQLIASLHHPNIVQIHDFQIFQPDGTDQNSFPHASPIAYMVMDYIEGSTLAHYIATTSGQGKFPALVEIVKLFASISLAIDYAHRQGMVHRDIKPANILLDKRNTTRNTMGEPILSDFGVAKLLHAPSITQTGIQLGTPLYTSPEQIEGHPASKHSDLYSLAAILYQVVTGVVPFQGDTLIDIMTQHSNTIPILPSLINPKVPSALDEVIMRGLAKDPAYRFPSAAAMTAAVAHALGVAVPEILRSQDTPIVQQDLPTIVTAQTPAPIMLAEQSSGTNSTPSSSQRQELNTSGGNFSAPPTPQIGQTGENTPVAPLPTSVKQNASTPDVLPTTPLQPANLAKPNKTHNNRIITWIAGLLIVCIIAGIVVAFYIPGLLAPSTPIIGQAFYTSSGLITPGTAQGIADEMQIDLRNISPPQAGKSYYVWLLDDKIKVGGADLTGPAPIQPPILLTNNLPVRNGQAHFFFPGDAQHNNLLSETSRLLITEENANLRTSAPSNDKATWRYFAMLPQEAIPGDPTQLNAVNHIRHLFYNETRAQVAALPGGLDFWLSRNIEKVLELSVTARDDWNGTQTSPALMQPLFIRILDYLDGLQNVHVDLSASDASTVINATDTTNASIALLTVDPLRQNADLPHNPVGYIDHIQLHLSEVVRAPDVSPEMRSNALQILTAVKNAGNWLQQVHEDAVALYHMESNDPTQLQQPQTSQLLDDMVTKAAYAYIGQLDPMTHQIHGGAIQAHYGIQKLAVLSITKNLPSSL